MSQQTVVFSTTAAPATGTDFLRITAKMAANEKARRARPVVINETRHVTHTIGDAMKAKRA